MDPENTQQLPQRRGTGKVARLPAATRDQINQMILDGVPYADIIQKIGEPAKDLTEDKISNWKTHGGYEYWLIGYQRAEDIRATREAALALTREKAAFPVQEAGRTVAAAQLFQLLFSLSPETFNAAVTKKPELYIRLISTLCRVSEGEAVCAHRQTQQALAEAKLHPQKNEPNIPSEEQLKEIARLIKLL